MSFLKKMEIKSYKKLGVGHGVPMYKSMKGVNNTVGKLAKLGQKSWSKVK